MQCALYFICLWHILRCKLLLICAKYCLHVTLSSRPYTIANFFNWLSENVWKRPNSPFLSPPVIVVSSHTVKEHYTDHYSSGPKDSYPKSSGTLNPTQLNSRQQDQVIKKGKGSVFIQRSFLYYTQGAQAWITQFYLQLHQCLHLPRKRSLDGASPDGGCAYLIAAYYSFIYPERLKG